MRETQLRQANFGPEGAHRSQRKPLYVGALEREIPTREQTTKLK